LFFKWKRYFAYDFSCNRVQRSVFDDAMSRTEYQNRNCSQIYCSLPVWLGCHLSLALLSGRYIIHTHTHTERKANQIDIIFTTTGYH
jgi:hypothetical protein